MLDQQYLYPLVWKTDHLLLVDQTRIPRELSLIEVRRAEDLGEAIQRRIIRGPAMIRVALAYALGLAAQKVDTNDRTVFLDTMATWIDRLDQACYKLPNFTSPLRSLGQVLQSQPGTVAELKAYVVNQAQQWHLADLQTCVALGEVGLQALPEQPEALRVLAYGNCGGLTHTGYGTVMGVIRSARREKRLERVYVAETRPGFEGAKYTAWECVQENIPVTIVTDGMVATILAQGAIDVILVGAETLAANGDVLNAVGTYGLALVAQAHRIPVIVVAPSTTIDWQIPQANPQAIPYHDAQHFYEVEGQLLYPPGADVYNPASDWTPAALIRAIVTEKGWVTPDQLGSLP